MFEKYISSIYNAKMVEVCSTTLPQVVLPRIKSHPKYTEYLEERVRRYEKYSNIACDILKNVKGIQFNRTNGAFYMTVVFLEGLLNSAQSLPIEMDQVRVTVERMVSGPDVSPDKRFVYYLLASTGVCVVPLTSFATELNGFRVTLLEKDERELVRVFKTIAVAIEQYLMSG